MFTEQHNKFWENHLKRNYQENYVSSYKENAHTFASANSSYGLGSLGDTYIFTESSLIKIQKYDNVYDAENMILPKLYRKHSDVEHYKHTNKFVTKVPNSTRLSSKLIEDEIYQYKCECFQNKLSLSDISYQKVLNSQEFWNTYKESEFSDEAYNLKLNFFKNATTEGNSFILFNMSDLLSNFQYSLLQRYGWETNIVNYEKKEMILITQNEYVDDVVNSMGRNSQTNNLGGIVGLTNHDVADIDSSDSAAYKLSKAERELSEAQEILDRYAKQPNVESTNEEYEAEEYLKRKLEPDEEAPF